jgi:hypothetical protein
VLTFIGATMEMAAWQLCEALTERKVVFENQALLRQFGGPQDGVKIVRRRYLGAYHFSRTLAHG